MGEIDTSAEGVAGVLSELARVKALFQARALAAVMGFPPPTTLEPKRRALSTEAGDGR